MIQLGQTTAQLAILQFDHQPQKRRPVPSVHIFHEAGESIVVAPSISSRP